MTLDELESRLWRICPKMPPGRMDLMLRAIVAYAEQYRQPGDEKPPARKTARTYMGNPCKKGHPGERYETSGNCVECHRVPKKTTAGTAGRPT